MYLYEEKGVFFTLLLEMIITIVFLVIQSRGYDKLIRECEKEMEDNIIIRKIKDKQLNVNSVDNFVNKYVSNFKFCGLKLYTIKKICGQLLNFVFITWCIISIYGIYLEVSIKDVLWTTMLGILLVGGLFSIGHSVDNSKCEYIAMVNLKNILEEYIYFYDDNYKVVYDSLSNEVFHVACEKEEDDLALEEEKINTQDERKEWGNQDSPQQKREKLKRSVFASGEDKRSGKNNKVELNSENLGYLADYS